MKIGNKLLRYIRIDDNDSVNKTLRNFGLRWFWFGIWVGGLTVFLISLIFNY